MLLAAIWAEAHDHAIAKGSRLPWNVPEDKRFFKQTVSGRPILMGRKTWESMGRRPIPGSLTLVITGQADYEAPGAQVVHSLDEALATAVATGTDLAWVGGGAGIYAETQPFTDILVRTLIDEDVDADTFAPELDGNWEVRDSSPEGDAWHTSKRGPRYRFEIRARRDVKVPADIVVH